MNQKKLNYFYLLAVIYNNYTSIKMSTSHSSSNDSRKAVKKLREIDKLKLQSSHTNEEIEKLKTETHYRRIVNPLYKSEEEKHKEFLLAERKRKETEDLKQRQYARHLEKEKLRQQKNEKERKEREKEREEEKKREERSKSYYERGKKYTFDFDIKPQIKQPTSLELEYYSLLEKHENNNDKTFRVLSKKYHPDKNLDKKDWAEKQQKQLAEIRECIRDRGL
jgi:hypothetical protein